MANITYSTNEDATEVVFSAANERAERWMGAPEQSVTTAEAAEYKKAAEDAGFVVIQFP